MSKTAKSASKARKQQAQPKRKSLKYADLLQQSSAEKDAEELKFVVRSKQLQLEGDLSKTEQKLMEKRKERSKMISSPDLDFVKLSALDDELQSLEIGLIRLEDYKNLF
jgi:hypothetical protein